MGGKGVKKALALKTVPQDFCHDTHHNVLKGNQMEVANLDDASGLEQWWS